LHSIIVMWFEKNIYLPYSNAYAKMYEFEISNIEEYDDVLLSKKTVFYQWSFMLHLFFIMYRKQCITQTKYQNMKRLTRASNRIYKIEFVNGRSMLTRGGDVIDTMMIPTRRFKQRQLVYAGLRHHTDISQFVNKFTQTFDATNNITVRELCAVAYLNNVLPLKEFYMVVSGECDGLVMISCEHQIETTILKANEIIVL
jgi:hypothetical protein